MNRAFRKLGYTQTKSGEIKPILLGRPKAVDPVPPAPQPQKDYYQIKEDVARELAEKEAAAIRRAEWEKGLRGNP